MFKVGVNRACPGAEAHSRPPTGPDAGTGKFRAGTGEFRHRKGAYRQFHPEFGLACGQWHRPRCRKMSADASARARAPSMEARASTLIKGVARIRPARNVTRRRPRRPRSLGAARVSAIDEQR